MARNNINRVPPPTEYFGTIDVTSQPSEDALFFTSINDAIQYLTDLPVDINPLNEIPWGIRLHPGYYPERFDLPKNVGIFGVSPSGTYITGGEDVYEGDTIVGIHNATLSNVYVRYDEQGEGFPETEVWIKNSLSLYTTRQSDWDLPLDTRQLIITPEGYSTETFIFTENETDAEEVADFINNAGINITAIVIHNQVEILGPSNTKLTVDKFGTANIIFGFATTIDQATVSNENEFLVMNNVFVIGTADILLAILFSDTGGGVYYLTDITTAGTQIGIGFGVNSLGVIRSAFPFFHSVAGVYVDDSALATFEGGNSKNNIGQDVVIIANAELIARAFAYKKITNAGILTPSGSRLTFEWNVIGLLVAVAFADGPTPVPHNITIESVQFTRRLNGLSGTTIIDVNKGPTGGPATTLYTTQANRPAVTSAEGNDVVKLATLPDILEIAKGSFLSIDIDQAEPGGGPAGPNDLHVVVTAVVN